MKLLGRLRRRWRSISFKSGLLASLAVGVVASLASLVLVFVVFILFVVTDGISQFGVIDRAEDQLRLGVEPADLDLPPPSLFTQDPGGPNESTGGFWAVLQDGEVLISEGDLDLAVVNAEFSEPGFGVEFSPDPDANFDSSGLKRLNGSEWLYVEREVTTSDGAQYLVVSGTEGTFTYGSFLRNALVGIVPTVLVLMAVAMAITSYLTRRALRRVERIRSEVELISQQSLNRRVPVADAADGIDKLALTMNDMLERLESSSAQQNRFLADASHELRSPVAGLVAQLDVAAAYPDRVDTAVLLPKLQSEAGRLQNLVNDLLYLSRAEAGASASSPPPAPRAVDIDALVSSEVEHQQLVNPDAVIQVGATCSASVNGNASDLQRAVRNLTTNAIRHSHQRVVLGCRSDGQHVVISVADDGPGVPESDANTIFDRFVRLDEARARDAGGAGLGLAISREIAEKHGGSLVLANPGSPGAVFELSLPRT